MQGATSSAHRVVRLLVFAFTLPVLTAGAALAGDAEEISKLNAGISGIKTRIKQTLGDATAESLLRIRRERAELMAARDKYLNAMYFSKIDKAEVSLATLRRRLEVAKGAIKASRNQDLKALHEKKAAELGRRIKALKRTRLDPTIVVQEEDLTGAYGIRTFDALEAAVRAHKKAYDAYGGRPRLSGLLTQLQELERRRSRLRDALNRNDPIIGLWSAQDGSVHKISHGGENFFESRYSKVTPFLDRVGHKLGFRVCKIWKRGRSSTYDVRVLWRFEGSKRSEWKSATWTLNGDQLDGAKLTRVKEKKQN